MSSLPLTSSTALTFVTAVTGNSPATSQKKKTKKTTTQKESF